MIMPALKSIDDIFEVLNKCREEERSLGDIERHAIENRLEEMRNIQPAIAFIGLGMLATLDRDEAAMRKYFNAALHYEPNSILVYFNYAISVSDFGCTDEAISYFNKVLQDEYSAAKFLDRIASAAFSMANDDLALQVLHIANKLHIKGPHICMLMANVFIANAESDEEEREWLEKFLPTKFLKKNSTPITEKKWKEMTQFAEDMQRYI